MKTHIHHLYLQYKCYSSFDELLPIESRSQHELWGWETLFQELNSFLRDADRHLGNATVNYAQYVVDRLEITVRTISQLKEHMEAEMTSIEERNRRSGMSMWQQIHLLDNSKPISVLYLVNIGHIDKCFPLFGPPLEDINIFAPMAPSPSWTRKVSENPIHS